MTRLGEEAGCRVRGGGKAGYVEFGGERRGSAGDRNGTAAIARAAAGGADPSTTRPALAFRQRRKKPAAPVGMTVRRRCVMSDLKVRPPKKESANSPVSRPATTTTAATAYGAPARSAAVVQVTDPPVFLRAKWTAKPPSLKLAI